MSYRETQARAGRIHDKGGEKRCGEKVERKVGDGGKRKRCPLWLDFSAFLSFAARRSLVLAASVSRIQRPWAGDPMT